MSRIGRLFHYYFNLDTDKDSEDVIIESITRNISFRGVNLWTLVFAIIIASVGLNVNATAVIIGAMLISPLMGPIMGVGLGIGIFDFDIMRRGLKNLLIAVVISLVTSTLYFWLTPLHNPTSELLARTTPTIWDVFIAFTGGLAGIVGATRKEKGNIIPGVAIATALMPPLCTAGYGIASGHWYFAFGALYLFFINSVFICIATVLILRFMHMHRRVFQTEARRRTVMRYIVLVVVVTITPSIWLAYRIVQKAIFENAAQTYVRKEFNFRNTQVINRNFSFDPEHPRIELLLIGEPLDSLVVDSLTRRLPEYKLDGTRLLVRQGMNAQREFDFSQIRASILDEAFGGGDTSEAIAVSGSGSALPTLGPELGTLFPEIRRYSLDHTVMIDVDSAAARDTVLLFTGVVSGPPQSRTSERLQRWLSARFSPDSVQVILRQADR